MVPTDSIHRKLLDLKLNTLPHQKVQYKKIDTYLKFSDMQISAYASPLTLCCP